MFISVFKNDHVESKSKVACLSYTYGSAFFLCVWALVYSGAFGGPCMVNGTVARQSMF